MNSNVRFLSARALAWVVTVAVVAGLGVAPASAADDAAGKCEQSKAKGAGKHASCRANVYAGAIKKAVAADGEKLTKCSDKVTSSFTKAEEKAAGACPTTGDSSAVEGIVDACIDDVVTALGGAPGAGGDNAKCQSAKAKEAGKYASCRLKAAAKGIKEDLAADYSKCEEKLNGKWAKLEEKPCATTGDLTAIKADLDACTTAVETAIDGVPDPVVEISEDFESLDQASPTALGDAGWLVGANVFSGLPGTGGGFLYNYFAFPAPNGGAAFSAIVIGQGGTEQGNQQMSVYSDYNNADHANGNTIEGVVFQSRVITADDVGSTFTFEFDHKLGNLNSASDPQCPSALGGAFDGTPCANTATAFIRVFDPGFSLLDNPTANMTLITNTWNTTSLTTAPIPLAAVGGVIQIGFLTNASLYQPTGIFYDNVLLTSLATP